MTEEQQSGNPEDKDNKDYVLTLIRNSIQSYTEEINKVRQEIRELRRQADTLNNVIEKLESSEKEIIEKWN